MARKRRGRGRPLTLAIFGAVALLVAWTVGIEPRLLDVRRERAPIPGLPAEWEGARIAALGDFQVGMWLGNEGEVAEAVRAMLEARVDAVLLLGDFIYAQEGEPAAKMEEVKRLLAPLLRAGVPTLAVLGNHDYGQDEADEPPIEPRARIVRAGLEELGVRVLQNEAIALARTAGGAPLHVVGVGPAWSGKSDPAAALAQVPPGAPRVLFMHNPLSLRAVAAGEAPLAVAGHSHGGQIRLPFMPDWSWLTLVKGTEAVDGWIDASYGAPGNRLYVNRGIGFSTVPVRLNCRPELTIFTLERGEPRPRPEARP